MRRTLRLFPYPPSPPLSLFLSLPGYHALPALRRRLKRAASTTAAFAALRTLWAAWSPLASGAPLPTGPILAVAAAATAVGAAHALGSGFGRPQHERKGALALLPALALLLALLVTGLASFEHTVIPRASRRPAQAAAALTERAGLAPGASAALARAVDTFADGGVAVAALCVATTARAYIKLAAGGGKRD